MSKRLVEADYINKKFDKLTILKFCERKPYQKLQVLCECECGNIKEIMLDSIKQGRTKSCGCLNSELARKRTTTHGHYYSRLHKIWANMKSRCYNKNNSNYYRYGARGISVCDEWRSSFGVFWNWALANGYSDGLTIERNNNDGNYEPKNCRWTTMNEQCHNRGIKASNISGVTGVSWRSDRNKWSSIIWNDKKLIYLGLFDTIEAAAEARRAAEKKYWNKE